MKFQVGDLIRTSGACEPERDLIILEIDRKKGNPIMFWDLKTHRYVYGDEYGKMLVYRAKK